MPNIARIRALWTGFQGSPGYSNFYFSYDGGTPSDLNAYGTDVATLFTAVRTFLPPDVTIAIQPNAVIIDAASGHPVGEELVGAVSGTTGQAPGVYAAPTGFCVHWLTGVYRTGRQIKGTTYFVPAGSSAFQSDGSIDPDALTSITNAAAAFIANQATPKFGIWSRPHKGAADGSFTTANLGIVPDKAVIMRSRRD